MLHDLFDMILCQAETCFAYGDRSADTVRIDFLRAEGLVALEDERNKLALEEQRLDLVNEAEAWCREQGRRMSDERNAHKKLQPEVNEEKRPNDFTTLGEKLVLNQNVACARTSASVPETRQPIFLGLVAPPGKSSDEAANFEIEFDVGPRDQSQDKATLPLIMEMPDEQPVAAIKEEDWQSVAQDAETKLRDAGKSESQPATAPKDEKATEIDTAEKATLDAFMRANGYEGTNEKKQSVGCLSRKFEYPLHSAVKDRHVVVVRLLLLAGADRSAKNSSKQTALELARKVNKSRSHDEVINLLRCP